MIAAVAFVLAISLFLVKLDGKVRFDWWTVSGIVAALLVFASLLLAVSVRILQSA
jgi:hypothetical protein